MGFTQVVLGLFCSPCWPCKNTRSFCRKPRITLYYPKCRPSIFSPDHFVEPGFRRLVCTYKNRDEELHLSGSCAGATSATAMAFAAVTG